MDSGAWSFLEGSMSNSEVPAIYDEQQPSTAAIKNKPRRMHPGSRGMSALWVTRNDNETAVWVFGGLRRGEGGKASSNDLWKAPLNFVTSSSSSSSSFNPSGSTGSQQQQKQGEELFSKQKLLGLGVIAGLFIVMIVIWKSMPRPNKTNGATSSSQRNKSKPKSE
jgi:hypothetical protein